MTTFESVQAFLDDNPARKALGRITDFGDKWWTGGVTWPKYRVAWMPTTGEFYAVNLGGVHHPHGGDVEVLGIIKGQDAAEAALAGWADLDAYEAQLGWVRERIEPPQKEDVDDES